MSTASGSIPPTERFGGFSDLEVARTREDDDRGEFAPDEDLPERLPAVAEPLRAGDHIASSNSGTSSSGGSTSVVKGGTGANPNGIQRQTPHSAHSAPGVPCRA